MFRALEKQIYCCISELFHSRSLKAGSVQACGRCFINDRVALSSHETSPVPQTPSLEMRLIGWPSEESEDALRVFIEKVRCLGMVVKSQVDTGGGVSKLSKPCSHPTAGFT